MKVERLTEIKKLIDVATEQSNTLLTFASTLVDDMNGNSVQPDVDRAALRY